ncbi:MAG TPA: translation initiation factor IF-3 [Dehalococcoidia bacterium]|nr:translation initiation factor IF-3 [Dehalococcoidia bacterium]
MPAIARELRINDRIRAREVLLIDGTGERLGVMPTTQALEMAREAELDLVEVAPTAVPPVCRLLDYGKFKYEQAKKERESRKSQHASVLREIRMRPKIDTHDLQMKARNAEKFLKSGDKVKVTVMFRGREMVHPEIGRAILDRVAEQLKEVSVIEKPPNMEGRFLSAILAPGHTKQQTAKEAEPAPAEQGTSNA